MFLYRKHTVKIFFILYAFLGSLSAAYSQKSETEFQNINMSYALEYLQKAVHLYASKEYANTLDYIRKGRSYDDSFADFLYLEAQCLLHERASKAKALITAEQAAAHGLQFRIFNREDVLLLLARLYTETKQYRQVCQVLDELPFPSADKDFYYASALYGLQKDEDARNRISEALNRWSFDVRFAKLFFLQERNKLVSRSGKKLADLLIRNLYVWVEQDPAIAVYAAPFDPNPRENNRRLKVYRNMYKGKDKMFDPKTVLSAVLAELRYGVIDEKTAVEEFFQVQQTSTVPLKEGNNTVVIFSDQLIELCRMVGMVSVRKMIAEQLRTFNGAVLEDENNDGFLNAAVFFEHGRPISAFFDPNQDEEYEYQVVCDLGTPHKITTAKNGYDVQYDTYPAVRSIIQKTAKKIYTLRPLSLRWDPIEQYELDVQLKDSEVDAMPFFTLRLREQARLLQEHDIMGTVLYSDEMAVPDPESQTRTHFEKGQILSVETKKYGKLVSSAQYLNGHILQKKGDYDGDGFFEILEDYNSQGKIEKISVDNNKNKLFEYYELYMQDGSIIKNWDENEDGSPEIQYTQFASGDARTIWKHRYSGKPVSVFYRKKTPETLTIGEHTIPIIREPEYQIYWLEKRPRFSEKLAKKLEEVFMRKGTEFGSYTAIIDIYELYAVRSEGAIFVQLFPAPRAEVEGGKQ